MARGLAEDRRQVAGQQVPPVDEDQRRLGHEPEIRGAAAVPLLDRAPRVADALPVLGGQGERDVGPLHARQHVGRARALAEQVPAGVGGQRHRDLRHHQPARLVAVGVDRRHQGRERGQHLGRLLRHDAPRPELGAVDGAVREVRLGRLPDAGELGEPDRVPRDEVAVGDARVDAGRRQGRVVGDPSVHRQQQRAQEPRVVVRVARLLAARAPRREAAGAVLPARERVDAHVVHQRRVGRPVDGGVDERRRPPPVLVGRVRVEHLRHVAGLDGREQPVLHVRLGVVLRDVGEREDVARVELVQERVPVARRLGEAVVEAAAPAAGDVRHDAVERAAGPLVAVVAVVEERAQEAPALRHPPGDGVVDRARRQPQLGALAVLHTRDHVAHGGRPEADQRGVLRHVDDVVELVRLEAPLQVDAGRIVDDLAARLAPREAPLVARHHPPRLAGAVAHGHHVGGVVGVGDLVGDVAAVGERPVPRALVHHHLAAHQPRDGRPVVGRHRRVQPHLALAHRHVELPAEPQQRESVLEQEPVAHLLGALRIAAAGGVVEVAEHALPAAVRHLVEDGAVAPGGVGRLQQVEVGAELDQAAVVPGREVDVGDDAVGGVRGVDLEVHHAAQRLVGAGQPVGAAVRDVVAGVDLDADHVGRRGAGEQQEQGREGGNRTGHGQGPPGPERSGAIRRYWSRRS